MPNKVGWMTKAEVLETGLPYFFNKDNIAGWSSKAYTFAVLISKTRCKGFGCPILSNGMEKPSAYRYVNSPGHSYRYVPLYDRTEFFRSGSIQRKQLMDHEIMDFTNDLRDEVKHER
ncbi:MAG: hypothetical protein JWM44_4196 [Bacilli bacterium]|nr:hypothetical protein [Bacilli bacterium]